MASERAKLCVEIGRFNLGQHIAFLDVRAVVEIPLLQIAVDAGIDRRLVPGLHGAGQHEMLGGGAGARRDDSDCRDGLFLRPLPHLRLMAAPLQNAERGNGDRRQNRDHADPAQVARRRQRSAAVRGVHGGHQVLR